MDAMSGTLRLLSEQVEITVCDNYSGRVVFVARQPIYLSKISALVRIFVALEASDFFVQGDHICKGRGNCVSVSYK